MITAMEVTIIIARKNARIFFMMYSLIII